MYNVIWEGVVFGYQSRHILIHFPRYIFYVAFCFLLDPRLYYSSHVQGVLIQLQQ